MQNAYRFRLYPTKEQERKLIWTLDKCRFVYNNLLEGLNDQKKINRNESQHSIVKVKKQFPELKEVYSKVLQYENYRLFSNLRALAKLKNNGKRVGKLRFKSKNWFKTFSYNQSGFKIIKNQTRYDKLHLSKIGDIPFIMHREIEGKMKQVTVKHYPSGKWYAFIITESKKEIQPTQNTRKVGIDLGIIHYVYDSNGNHFDNPKNLGRSSKKLRKEQRKLSRKGKKSKNRLKQKIKVARFHEKIMNQRDDFLHKLSRSYVTNYGFIAVEDLNIRGLIRICYNAKNIMDASWLRFIQMLEYKAERAGVQVIKVEPRGTTQRCSRCGNLVEKSLAVRTHKCQYCGLIIERDYNSAINILKRALGQELSESTPVEIGPLPVRASSVCETGSFLHKWK